MPSGQLTLHKNIYKTQVAQTFGLQIFLATRERILQHTILITMIKISIINLQLNYYVRVKPH